MSRYATLGLLLTALLAPLAARAVDQPIAGKKLIIKRSGSGAEKLVWISKDAGFLFPAIGGADDPADTAGATVDIFSENEAGDGSLTMPAGVGNPGWSKKDAAVDLYKFVNTSAPAGISAAKVAVLKDGKLLKVVAKATGLALAGAQGSVGIRLTTGTLRSCSLFAAANASIKKDEANRFIAKDATTAGFADCGDATLGGGIGTTTTSIGASTTITTTSSTTTSTAFVADWGLDCFSTMTCGPGHCPMFGAQCTDYIESIGLMTGSEMCFFDCMDDDLMDVTDCRDDCGGSPAPACETGVAGGGGFTGVVTGAGKCTPSGFAGSFTLGGSATEFKRVIVDFGTPIAEATLFTAPPPACSGTCPSPGSACDVGAPYAAAPLADVFRLQIGAASPPAEVCERSGVVTTVCKYSPTGYAFIVAPPGISASAAAPVDLSAFISCHVTDVPGTTFLHFATGDFFAVGSWPP
jgi:hypothetical protein